MNEDDKNLLNKYGWTLECKSPFEISNKDGSFASNEAANIVLLYLQEQDRLELLSHPLFKRYPYRISQTTLYKKVFVNDYRCIQNIQIGWREMIADLKEWSAIKETGNEK